MKTELCEKIGIDVPIFAFTHCRDVVVEVSKAGGIGVLGAAGYTPEELEQALKWIDDHIEGKPYGVDVLIPEVQAVDHAVTADEIVAAIPAQYRDMTVKILEEAGVSTEGTGPISGSQRPNTSLGQELLEVSFNHPVRLIAKKQAPTGQTR